MDDGNRIPVELKLDKAPVEQAPRCGLDPSRLGEHALRSELRRTSGNRDANSPAEQRLADMQAEIRSRNATIEEDGLYGQEWHPL